MGLEDSLFMSVVGRDGYPNRISSGDSPLCST